MCSNNNLELRIELLLMKLVLINIYGHVVIDGIIHFVVEKLM